MHFFTKAFFVFLLSCFYAQLHAQEKLTNNNIPKRQYFTKRLSDQLVKLDGMPNEAAWDMVTWSGDFVQYQPDENEPASQPTVFKILYDHRYLYVAFKCFDSMPHKMVRRMGRRDEFPGDWMEINIDSYHDLRTAFSFTLSASGVRGDELVSNNGKNWDANWNPIWYGKTNINDSGWTAEMKIPLSQLRYGNEKEKVWGLQVKRMIFRREERSVWQYIPQSGGYWVSGFGELRGLNDVPAQKQIELAPYVVAQTARYKKEEGNPFATGSDNKLSAGVDGKIAVTSDLILDFTVNPDFGQVEADPSQVRIDGYQNFFEERRPFFIESRNIFDYRLTGSAAGGGYDADLLFYSRRIGSSPHGYPNLRNGEYAKIPERSSILGAAKFSGKTKNGWSIGILESLTKREFAEIDSNGERRKEIVEPLSNYFVTRIQKDVDEGNTVLGGMFTAVHRENDLQALLHKQAYTGGLDFTHFWKNRAWYYAGNFTLSHVAGSKEAILNTQTSFEHLFQRTNINEARVDGARTSLTGTAGSFRIGKSGGNPGKYGQIFQFETGGTWRSPQLELNDIGFMLTANEINHFTWAGINYQQPFSIFRNLRYNYNHWARWDFGGQLLYVALNVNARTTFKNFWSAVIGADWNPYEVSNNALRGGSSLRKPPGGGCWVYINTDSRKKLTASLNVTKAGGFANTVKYNDVSLGINAQPFDAFRINVSGSYSRLWRRQDQFVDKINFNNQTRVIVAEVNQETIRMTLRFTYNITPDLTVQYYGQPFITRPLYNHYAYVIDPLNASYNDRFHRYANDEIRQANGRFEIDEDRDGTIDYSFYKPDFNFVQFRSNLVIRWEYIAGSECYLVWSSGNTPNVANDIYSPIGNSLFENIFSQQARDIFLIKFTYRFLK